MIMMIEAAADIRHTRITSPLGELLLVGERRGARLALRGLYFADARPPAVTHGSHEDGRAFERVAVQLAEYFAGERTRFELDLSPHGTAFQHAVWRALSAIPYGETTTYAAVARAIGSPRAVRAVGAANARNPLAIVIPCHRVIGADGTLTGYAGGLPMKRSLLALELRGRARPAPLEREAGAVVR